jgi:hypothetical protein
VHDVKILDAAGLGRWSGITLEGHNSKKILIITAYRDGSPKARLSAAPSSTNMIFSEESFTLQFILADNFSDLLYIILSLQEAGHCVILMLDANSMLEENDLSDFNAACGLHDLHLVDSPLSIFIGAAYQVPQTIWP